MYQNSFRNICLQGHFELQLIYQEWLDLYPSINGFQEILFNIIMYEPKVL